MRVTTFSNYHLFKLSHWLFVVCYLFPTAYSFAQDSAQVQIHIGFVQGDSTKTLTAKVTKGDTIPVEEVEVLFYVKRLFGLLPLESTFGNVPTDKKGETSMKLPKIDFPGDTAGNIVIVAKIEDDDNYGNVETQATLKIGTPLVISDTISQRALWAVKSPWGIILFFVIIIGGVWCTYCYVAYLTSRIRKAGNMP